MVWRCASFGSVSFVQIWLFGRMRTNERVLRCLCVQACAYWWMKSILCSIFKPNSLTNKTHFTPLRQNNVYDISLCWMWCAIEKRYQRKPFVQNGSTITYRHNDTLGPTPPSRTPTNYTHALLHPPREQAIIFISFWFMVLHIHILLDIACDTESCIYKYMYV